MDDKIKKSVFFVTEDEMVEVISKATTNLYSKVDEKNLSLAVIMIGSMLCTEILEIMKEESKSL